MRLRTIMTRDPMMLAPDDSVEQVWELFRQHGFHHLLVAEHRRLVGVISDRDLLRNISPFLDKLSERAQDRATLNRRVHQIMTRKPVTAPPDIDSREAARLMLEHAVSCLPIVENERAVGIVTSRDVLADAAGNRRPAA